MHILVVDDQEINRALLQQMLEPEGYQVSLAENGLQAIQTFTQLQPDIVLLDVVMPVLDGYDTATKLKQLAGDLYLPIIFITALDDDTSLIRCLEAGGDDFLSKPFNRVILNAKIKAHSRTRELSLSVNQQNKALTYHQNHVSREHEIIEHIFNNALSGNIDDPELIESHISPASMFNGDILLTSRSANGTLYVLMGDFTGHGLTAAVGALPLSRVFYAMSAKGLSISDISAEMNSLLLYLLPDDMFFAAILLEISASGKTAAMWAGGMPDVLHISAKDNKVGCLCSQHMALGILEEDEFERNLRYIDLNEGDRLVLYTDGLIEAANEQGELFGQSRLEQIFSHSQSPNIDNIAHQVLAFQGDSRRTDDISIALINVKIHEENTHSSSLLTGQTSSPFEVQVSLDSQHIQKADPVTDILSMLAHTQELANHRTNIYMLLSELYNNAIDHGLLELDSTLKDDDEGFINYYHQRQTRLEQLTEGHIDIICKYEPQKQLIHIEVTDNGKGYEALLPNVNVSNELHGRGLGIVMELAENMHVSNGGCTIGVSYNLSQHIC